MDEKYFEIPVSVINDSGELEELKSYIATGNEDSVRMRAAKVLEEEFKGQDYDYDVIEITPDEFETFETVEYLPGEDAPMQARSMEDEMEDLQDRYYTLEDKLNSLPANKLDKTLVEDARMRLNEAKDYFDQYDFFKCTASLNAADDIISNLIKDE